MMLDLSRVSTIPWVIGVFLLVKMLFSKADGARSGSSAVCRHGHTG